MWRVIFFFTFLGYVFGEKIATTKIRDPDDVNNVAGTIVFTKKVNQVLITGEISGLTAGSHGFHIHNFGKLDSGCLGTGPHFNPHNVNHGGPKDATRHVGDLGNIIANDDGVANINLTDNVIALDGDHNIIGRALVVHSGVDDLGKGDGDSLTTGNAGSRLACGVILEDEPSSSTIVVASHIGLMIGIIVTFELGLL